MTSNDSRLEDYVAGRWVETNPSFTASLDGTWLVEIGPSGPAFRRVDRLCATVRGSKVRGGGKFFDWLGSIVPAAGPGGATIGFNCMLNVTRTAMPWYRNAWTEAEAQFQVSLSVEMINPQYAWGEIVREGQGVVATYWHKLLA